MHSLIVGTTGCGKSTLAKKLSAGLKKSGKGVLVFDPLLSRDWYADYITDNKDDFLDLAKRSKNCVLFIDESVELGKFNASMDWFATRARHWGHVSFFICQRVQQLNKTVRDQCANLYLFRVSYGDAKILAEEFVQDELIKSCNLQRFAFIKTGRFSNPETFIL